jgi:hypothetical protein
MAWVRARSVAAAAPDRRYAVIRWCLAAITDSDSAREASVRIDRRLGDVIEAWALGSHERLWVSALRCYCWSTAPCGRHLGSAQSMGGPGTGVVGVGRRWWPVPVILASSILVQKLLFEGRYEVAGHAAGHLSSATAPFGAFAFVGILLWTTPTGRRQPEVLVACSPGLQGPCWYSSGTSESWTLSSMPASVVRRRRVFPMSPTTDWPTSHPGWLSSRRSRWPACSGDAVMSAGESRSVPRC